MCGIWGYISQKPFILSHCVEKSETVRSRGPERTIMIHSDHYFFAFHRLAINGTSGVKDQPYVYLHENGMTVYVMCNGEIYNAPELYTKVTGQPFISGMSDTEVIYHVYSHVNYNFTLLNRLLKGEYAVSIVYIDKDNIPRKCLFSTDYVSVRPLFYYVSSDNTTIAWSSLLKGLIGIPNVDQSGIKRLPGGTQIEIEDGTFVCTKYTLPREIVRRDIGTIKEKIVNILTQTVKDRLLSDRPIGCLLSGGLDSSLTSALIARELRKKGLPLYTFSVGLKDSPDCKYARLVADHIGSIHTEIIVTPEEAISVIPDVIRVIESYDITTIRASVWQYLLGRYISKHTDIKVVVAGEGSDELLGYVYFKAAPSAEEFQKETEKLIDEIHLYDGLRADRCISHFGLEARFPFLDVRFIEFVLSVSPEWKMHTGGRPEKWILREAFHSLDPELLPYSVLFRPKVAQSDGCSTSEKSWFQIIQDHIKEVFKPTNTEEETHCPPISDESRYYRELWNSTFSKEASTIIPHFWMPNKEWLPDVNDPSARTLSFYHKEEVTDSKE